VPQRAMIGVMPTRLDLLAVRVVVVRAIGEHRVRPSLRRTTPAPYWRNGLDQRHQLSDVVAVAAGQRQLQPDAVPFGDQMVFRARSGTVDRARSGFGPPFIARRCEQSTTALDQSSWPAAFNPASKFSCNRCHTPASFQSRNRQQVIPDPNPSFLGARTPTKPGVEDDQDAAQRLAVIRPRTAGTVAAPRDEDWQQRLDPSPQRC
jgi:hypothetical protein